MLELSNMVASCNHIIVETKLDLRWIAGIKFVIWIHPISKVDINMESNIVMNPIYPKCNIKIQTTQRKIYIFCEFEP
jgi:hypothetical protein